MRTKLRQLWQILGIWGVAFVVWSVGGMLYYSDLQDRHSEQPGPYLTPAKGAERKRVKGTINGVNIVLMALFAFHLYGYKLKHPPRNDEESKSLS